MVASTSDIISSAVTSTTDIDEENGFNAEIAELTRQHKAEKIIPSIENATKVEALYKKIQEVMYRADEPNIYKKIMKRTKSILVEYQKTSDKKRKRELKKENEDLAKTILGMKARIRSFCEEIIELGDWRLYKLPGNSDRAFYQLLLETYKAMNCKKSQPVKLSGAQKAAQQQESNASAAMITTQFAALAMRESIVAARFPSAEDIKENDENDRRLNQGALIKPESPKTHSEPDQGFYI